MRHPEVIKSFHLKRSDQEIDKLSFKFQLPVTPKIIHPAESHCFLMQKRSRESRSPSFFITVLEISDVFKVNNAAQIHNNSCLKKFFNLQWSWQNTAPLSLPPCRIHYHSTGSWTRAECTFSFEIENAELRFSFPFAASERPASLGRTVDEDCSTGRWWDSTNDYKNRFLPFSAYFLKILCFKVKFLRFYIFYYKCFVE